MKTRIFLVVTCLMLFASLSFGQGFCRQLYNDDHPLTGTCGGQDYIPDGTTASIYWDNDSNGPDADDPLAVVGDQVGQVNYNQLPLNGGSEFGQEGTFVSADDFCSNGGVPSPSRFYMRVNGSASVWTSEVATFGAGADVYDYNVWTCEVSVPSCTPGPDGQIFAEGSNVPLNISVCLELCTNHATLVRICSPSGAPLDPTKPPVSHIRPGCFYQEPGCDVECPPGFGDLVGPTYDGACWVYTIYGLQDGCVCFTLDRFLAAGIESFSGLAGDNEVMLSWVTSSETNVLSYAIVRNGDVVGSVASENSVTTHTYTYTDETAVNGTTYTYALRVINSDNSVTETGMTWEGTPSFSAAVVTEYALLQNFPNPFNPTTQIAFDVLNTNPVTLKIFNAAGQEVATLLNGVSKDNGRHVINFDSGNLTTGLYFYSVKIGNEFSATKKMLLVK